MKLSNAFALYWDLSFAIRHALFPTIKAILRSPSLLFHPTDISRIFMAKIWIPFGDGTDENSRAVKQQLITPNAHGVVLEIGAGYGHTTRYLDKTRVTRYVALEPNALMHSRLRLAANEAGFTESDGSLLIISCGAEDYASILSSVGGDTGHSPSVDTVVSILTLCTIPSPKETLASLVEHVLKPKGQLLFYEHVLSPRPDVAWWQRFWAPIWAVVFDGCRMDRPSHLWVEGISNDQNESVWEEATLWGKEGDPEENLFWHQVGKMVKRG